MLHFRRAAAFVGVLLLRLSFAIDVDFSNSDSIKSAASTIAYDMMTYYKGNQSGQIPGLLPKPPYYWWEAGAMFGALINYWHTTGDDTYNAVTMQALQFQVGPGNDYQPPNQTASLGNDDQAFWGIAAMAATEYNFPNPPKTTDPSWLGLAQAVFNQQIKRWDTKSCGGGIAWQIPHFNAGYNLKNTISNGCLFQIAARLARYTDDPLYAEWAEKIWVWITDVGLMDADYNVYDNAEWQINNCTRLDRNQWIYNVGTMLIGSAYMYNYTDGSAIWEKRLSGLLDGMIYDYFPNGVMKDICEQYDKCNTDQKSFKAYASRWLSSTAKLAPYTYEKIMPVLLSSARAAVAQCTGAPSGNHCGQFWWKNGSFEGGDGVGQQMSALEVVLGTMVQVTSPPVTNLTGGTSQGDKNAGNNTASDTGTYIEPATTADKAGAWILTVLMVFAVVSTIFFMWSRVWERREGHHKKGSPMWYEKRKSAVSGSQTSSRRPVESLQLPPPTRSSVEGTYHSNRGSRVKSVSFSHGPDGGVARPTSTATRRSVATR